VNKLSKRILLATVAVALFLGLVSTGLDLYANSRGVHAWLEAELSRDLGAPVKVGALHYSLWSGLRGEGLTAALAPVAPNAGGQATLTVPSVSAPVAFWPLFSRRVVVKQLVFAEPTLVWVQADDGRWSLPVEKQSVQRGDRPAPAETTGVTLLPPQGVVSEPPATPSKKRIKQQPSTVPQDGSKLEFNIRAAQIENATLRFLNREGTLLALVEGLSVHCPRGFSLDCTNGAPGHAKGTLSFTKATLRDGLAIDGFATPFELENGLLRFSHLDARLSGGGVRGAGTLLTGEAHPPFTLDLLFDGVDASRLLISLGQNQMGRGTEGTLHGNLDLYGRIGLQETLAGKGQVRVRSGRLEQMPLFQLIGKVLQIEDLTNMELRQAQLDLRADQGTVFVDSLVMESPNLSLTANGTSKPGGKLDLSARLAVNAKISRKLPKWVDANFQPVTGSERRAIDFNIGGTLERPQTNLMEVMVGQKTSNQIMDLFRAITGKPKKKGGDKKNAGPAPAPEQGLEPEQERQPQAQPSPTPAS